MQISNDWVELTSTSPIRLDNTQYNGEYLQFKCEGACLGGGRGEREPRRSNAEREVDISVMQISNDWVELTSTSPIRLDNTQYNGEYLQFKFL
jgi:hypothetical protein